MEEVIFGGSHSRHSVAGGFASPVIQEVRMETRSLWRELESESWRRRRRDYCGCGSDYLRSKGYTVIIDRSSMAPGTSSMLRARRRDVNVKPNRVLDRNSSRGMIYENEELRLRTININAEVEKGQHDIKKLRRENDQLRREIWNLRDEYDRLEAILKSKNISTDTEEEESEDEDEDEGEGGAEGEAPTAMEVTEDHTKDNDKLSVVEEESEWSDAAEDKPRTVSFKDDSLRVPGRPPTTGAEPPVIWPDSSYIPGPQIPVPAVPPTPVTLLPTMGFSPLPTGHSAVPMQQTAAPTSYFHGLDSNLQTFLDSVNVGREPVEPQPTVALATPRRPSLSELTCPGYLDAPVCVCPTCRHSYTVLTPGGSEVVTTAILQRRQSFAQSGDPTNDTFTCTTSQHTTGGPSAVSGGFTFPLAEPPNQEYPGGQCETYSATSPSFLRLNSVQPFTLVFSVTDPHLTNLSVQEVIDAMSDQLSAQLMHSLRGVRLVGGNCYLSFSSQQDADSVLRLPLTLRGHSLTAEDASVGATVVALSGVPHDVPDDNVAEVLAHFGSLVGPVERRLYKGVDTGERLVRLRARLAIPRWIWLEGCRVSLKILRSEELSGLSLARRKSFRSHISVQLRPVSEDTPPVPPLPSISTQSSPPIPPLPASSNSTTPFFTTPPRTSFPSTNPFMCGSVPSIPAYPNTTESQTSSFTNASASTPNIFHESPFFFPTTTQTDESPGLRRINSVMGTMSLGRVAPEISHTRSASSPPTTTATQVKSDSDATGQTSVPPSPNTARKAQRHKATRKISKISTDSRKTNGECSQTSSSDQDSPQKGRRRPSSVYFKQKSSPSVLNRTTSVDQTDVTGYDPTTCSERERSNSDLSSRLSICKRKLSTTGRESGKVPWCGCWGNGCI
ncbi:mucin-5AC-like [Macrosteles quadrilineatus]|uniref:mucin-5AC-like n=1 Tax=Macrosteles quadrilineatus TaxID=74068 RepID=UPI0023E1385C|nr:mucin-5AC-like [Macrosteles quadrilineatus]